MAAAFDSVKSKTVENDIGTISAPRVVQNCERKKIKKKMLKKKIGVKVYLQYAFPRNLFHCIYHQVSQMDRFHRNQLMIQTMLLASRN